MSSAAEISQPPQDSALRRYWRSFMQFADAEDAPDDWPFFLAASLLISAAVIALLHVIEHYGVRDGHRTATQAVAIAPAGLLAVALVGVLVLMYWQIRLDQARLGAYVVALLVFVVATGVCVEALAGVTKLHLQGSSAGVGLWHAEQAYIWHVLDAVPLVGIPGTLGWDEPAAGADHISGTLLLVFKLALLVPLLRLAVSAYHSLEKRALDRRAQRREEEQRGVVRSFDLALESGDVLRIVTGLTALAAATFFGWRFLFDPAAWPTAQLDRLLPETLAARGVSVPLDWATTAPQWAGVGAIGVVAFFVFLGVFAIEPRIRGLGGTAAVCLGYASVLMLLTECAVAVLLALTHVEAVPTSTQIPAHDQVGAAFSFVVRPVVDAVPGLDIPETLRWAEEDRFQGVVAGAVELTFKLAFFLVVLFPVARAIRAFVHDEAPKEPPRALLGGAARFADAYVAARAALDAAEAHALAGGTQFSLPLMRSLEIARQSVRALAAARDEAKGLFGPSDAGLAADEVLHKTELRLSAIDAARPWPYGPLHVTDPNAVRADLQTKQQAAEAAADAYSVRAAEALRSAAPPVS